MSFLNLMLLGGAAAFALPLLIHLLNRSRFQMVEWGAMHLLESALQSNSRRIQWQSILLLLIRCLIPILLAFALARPVLTEFRIAGGGGDKSLVLLIDNSFSMDRASNLGATSCLDVALKQAAEIIEKQSAATEYSIWTLGGTPSNVLGGTTFDRRRALEKLKSIRGGAGSVSIQAALATGIKQMQQMQNANRELLLISDFQGRDWISFNESEQKVWKSRLDAEAIRPQLSLMKIESTADKRNLAVTLESLDLPLIVAGQSFPIAVQVRNFGNAAVDDVAVVLRVGEKELTSRRVSIPASGKTQAVFACQIDAPGQHAIEVRLEDPAGLEVDNHAYRIVDVRQAVRVLLIDKQPDAPVLKRNSGYLSLALSPFQTNEAMKNYAITHTIAPNQIKPQVLAEYDVVIVSDIQRLENQPAEALASFVRGGGGLLWFAGKSLDINWYNSQLGPAAKLPLLPATIAERKPTEKQDGKPATKPDGTSSTNVDKIANTVVKHPALKEFSRPGASELSSVEISQIVTLGLPEPKSNPKEKEQTPEDSTSRESASQESATEELGAASDSVPQILLKLDDGSPLLVAQRYERGKVLQFAVSADDSWTNFPLRPAYVPLMQGLVQWLASGIDVTHNLITGEPIAMSLQEALSEALADQQNSSQQKTDQDKANQDKASKASNDSDQVFTVTIPGTEPGVEPIEIKTAANAPFNFPNTAFPGIYRVASGTETKSEALFAVNIQPGESETDPLELNKLQELASAVAANVAPTASSYFEQESLRNNGRELWRYLMLALVVFLFGELLLQQRISRGAA